MHAIQARYTFQRSVPHSPNIISIKASDIGYAIGDTTADWVEVHLSGSNVNGFVPSNCLEIGKQYTGPPTIVGLVPSFGNPAMVVSDVQRSNPLSRTIGGLLAKYRTAHSDLLKLGASKATLDDIAKYSKTT
jgi:hypothetical protein